MDATFRNHCTVILNRESGAIVKLGPEKVAEGLRAIFESLGCKAEIQSVSGFEVQAALEEARDSDSDSVIVGGGDGTVASAATIFAGHQKPLGILPLGTFNLAARDVGMPLDWQEAARILVSAPVREVDLLELDGKCYMCVVVLGFYPSLVMGQPEYHGSWLMKSIRTMWQTLRSAATYPPLALRLNDGERTQTFRTRLAILANNDYEDLFGVIPRRRSLSAGHFTVYVSKHLSRFGLLKTCITWILGRWKQDGEISMMRTTRLQIDVKRKSRISVMMDGELAKIGLPFSVTLKPKALRAICPRLAQEDKMES